MKLILLPYLFNGRPVIYRQVGTEGRPLARFYAVPIRDGVPDGPVMRMELPFEPFHPLFFGALQDRFTVWSNEFWVEWSDERSANIVDLQQNDSGELTSITILDESCPVTASMKNQLHAMEETE